MYNSVSEAIAIYHAISPSNIYTIIEHVSGQRMTGTARELYDAILEQDAKTNGNISHTPEGWTPKGPESQHLTEAWAILEAAYDV